MIWLQNLFGLKFPCVFHAVTGLYCPGCGGTRAVRTLLRGDILKSFQYHPLVPYALFAVLFSLITRWAGRGKAAAGYGKQEGILVVIGAGIIIINWIVKNCLLVFWGLDLLPLLK